MIDTYSKIIEDYLVKPSIELTNIDEELSNEYDECLLDAYTKIGEYIEEELDNE
jgi:hypothetical protein